MDDAHIVNCPLCAWQGDPKRCRWCNKPLSGRQRRWCSATCPHDYGRNHWWTDARRAAIERDRRCLRCGTSPDRIEIWYIEAFGAVFSVGDWWRYGRRSEIAAIRNEERRQAALEVNHINPRNGQGYGPGCQHHLDELETLCHRCHVEETNRQRRERRQREWEARNQIALPV